MAKNNYEQTKMKQVNANEIKKMNTLIKEFMTDRSNNNKTFKQLLKIFNSCYKKFSPDPSNDLRILKYSRDMRNNKWRNSITLVIQNDQVIDGVHRGIAFLKCLEDDCREKDLPKIYLLKTN